MRAILILIVVVALLAVGGWLVFDFSGNRASVEIRTDKIEQDTEKAWESSKQMLNRADEEIDDAVDEP